MRGFLKFLAGVLAVLFIITAVGTSFVVGMVPLIVDREALKRTVNTEAVAEMVPALLADLIWQQLRAADLVAEDLSPRVLEAAITALLPPDWAQNQVHQAIDGMMDFLETGDPGAAVLEVDLRELLARARGPAGREAVLAALEKLPRCRGNQRGFSFEARGFERDVCIPPDVPVAEAAVVVHAGVIEMVDQMPELQNVGVLPISLLGSEDGVTTRVGGWSWLPAVLGRVQRWIGLLWLVPLGCLLAIALLVGRSPADLGFWWGWVLLIAGVVTAFLAFLTPPLVMATLLASIPGPPSRWVPLLQSILDALFDQWLSRVYAQAGIMLVLSLPLIALSYIKREAHQPSGAVR